MKYAFLRSRSVADNRDDELAVVLESGGVNIGVAAFDFREFFTAQQIRLKLFEDLDGIYNVVPLLSGILCQDFFAPFVCVVVKDESFCSCNSSGKRH